MHEAEITSLCQRRKVEELEAKLHKAEDVITDLRMQLKEAKNQLEKEKKDKMQPMEGKIMNKITFSSRSTLEPDSSRPSSPELQTVSSNLNSTKMEQIAQAMYNSVPRSIDHLSASHVDIIHSHDSDSTSTVLRIKEHRLSSKRCPQRIRSLERNFLDYGLPLGIDVKDSQVLEGKEPLVKRRNKEERGLSIRTGKTDIKKNCHGAVLKRSVKLHSLRNTSQFGKCKTGTCRLHASQLTKPHHPSCIISICKPQLKDGDVRSDKSEYRPPLMVGSGKVTLSSRSPEEHKIVSYKDASWDSIQEQPKGNMKTGNLNGHSPDQPINPCDKSFVLSPCSTSINLVNDNRKSGEDHFNITKHQRKMKKLTCLDPELASTESYIDSLSVLPSVTASVKVNKSKVLENAAHSKKDLTALTVKQDSGGIRNLIFPSSKSNSEMNPDTKCEQICEVTNYSPCQVDKKMILRCTRQRKRKREAIDISDENISPGKSNAKSLREKLKFEPEFERSNLIGESTRESRQLSQVARQVSYTFSLFNFERVMN